MGCHKCATNFGPRLAVYTDETWAGWMAACKRAGGRRHYNAVRQARADFRRGKSVALWMKLVCAGVRGPGAKVARLFGVSRSTICRNVRWLHLLGEIAAAEKEHRKAGRRFYRAASAAVRRVKNLGGGGRVTPGG